MTMYSRSKKYVPPTWLAHSRQIGTLAESPPRNGACPAARNLV